MKYLNKFVFIFTMLIALVSFLPTNSAQAKDYVVVVNVQNGLATSQDDMHQQVRRVFLKQQSVWPGGIEAFPLGRNATDEALVAFLSNVLQMTDQEVASHWLRVKQQTGQTPPRVVGSASILLKLVGRRAGGMGFVSADDLTDVPDSVRVLFHYSD